MNFGSRLISSFNRVVPQATKAIGQISNISRNIGSIVQSGRNIGSIANQLSGGRLSQLPYADKIQQAANKVEQGANFVSGNEGKAREALATISRKINA